MAEANENQAASLGNKSKLLMILFVVLDLACLGAGGALTYMATLGYHKPQITETQAMEELKTNKLSTPDEPILYTLDGFTVNLKGAPRRIVHVEMSLEMLDEQGFEEVIDLGPKARDAVVRILNSKTFPEIESLQGKLFLKDEISYAINDFLDSGVVKDIYFRNFVVQ